MKKVRIAALAVLLGVTSVQAAERPWKLEREEEGVQVYLAEVPGSKYKAYRGVVKIKSDISRLLALQEDVAQSCTWIYSCQSQRLLESDGGHGWVYTRFDMPWPVKARDSILEVTTQKAADGSVTRLLKAAPERLPEDKDFVRVRRVDGLWSLRPLANGEVEVIYEVHTEPGGSVPSWLANSFVVDAPLQTLKALRSQAQAN